MNIPPSEAARLSLHDYESLVWNWNDGHESAEDVGAPDRDLTQRLIDRINSDPTLTH